MGAGGDVSARLRKGSKAVRHTDCRCKTHFKHSCSPQNPYAKQQVCPACTAAAQVLRWAQAVTAAEQLKTSLGRRAKHLKRLGPYFFHCPGWRQGRMWRMKFVGASVVTVQSLRALRGLDQKPRRRVLRNSFPILLQRKLVTQSQE